MRKSVLIISPEGLKFLRSKVSDHLVFDWLQLASEGFTEFKITDAEKVLRIARSTSKHKINQLTRAGLIDTVRMESPYMVYKLNTEGIVVSGSI